ncbi:hypothetical protein [Solibaculum mannosilyticum]
MKLTISGSKVSRNSNVASYYTNTGGITYAEDTGSYRGYGATTKITL